MSMRGLVGWFVFLVSCVPAYLDVRERAGSLHTSRYSNSWAVEVSGGPTEADRLAHLHGFVNHGQIGNLEGYYHFQLLESTMKENGISVSKRSVHSWQDEIGLQPLVTEALERDSKVGYVKQQQVTQRTKRDFSPPEDPRFRDQWSVVNTGQTCGPMGLDLNVEPAWLQGLDGSGVVVALVDDGLETRHPDLAQNYDQRASYDFVHNDSDPTPDISINSEEPNSHGTQCAGEVGMVKDNNKCGVGVAFSARIGGLKFNGAATTDLIESQALSHKNNYIQIYSSSWGPVDNGFTVEGPERLLKHVFKTSVQQGRNGKGSIYVWASGNGGDSDDSCAADGYSSSIYTISVGSANQNSEETFYDEECASKIAVTFTFNSVTYPSSTEFDPYDQITTTTLNGECGDDFTGTSASAPLVSAVIALCLQANQNLTWRDVQYLIAYTSNPDILSNGEFTTNGAGLKVSHKFGFGAIDTEAMVTRARRWITVPPQNYTNISASNSLGRAYPHQPLELRFEVTKDDTAISYLEHIEVSMSLRVENPGKIYSLNDYKYYANYVAENEKDIKEWLRDPHPRRGDIKVEITSPQKTTSILLPYRDLDFINDKGYDNWPFMSLHHWGENPFGIWTLTVTFRSSSASVAVEDLQMTLYGTTETPVSVSNIPRECDSACARGCSGPGPENCDVCREYRIPSTLVCVSECPNGTFTYRSHYCTDVRLKEVYYNKSSNCNGGKKLSLTAIILISVGVGVMGITGISCAVGVCICCAVRCYRKRKGSSSGGNYSILRMDAGDDDITPTPV